MNRSKRWHHLVFLILCFWHLSALRAFAADAVLEIGQLASQPLSVTPYFAVLEDPARTLTLADVQKAEWAERFITDARTTKEEYGFGFTRSAYWFRLTLRNSSDQALERILEIADSRISNLQFYEVQPDGSYSSLVTGNTLPFATRPYPNRFFVFHLTLAAHAEKVVYFRFQSTNALRIPGRLWEAQAFHAHERSDYVGHAWYYGMATAMILFNLLLFIALGDVIYLLYVSFIACTALGLAAHNGLLKEFVWLNSPRWSEISVAFAYSVGLAALLLFMRQMLNTAKSLSRLDRLFKILVGVLLLMPIGLAMSYSHTIKPSVLLNVITLLLILGSGLYCVVQRQRSAYFFMAAFAMLCLGAVMTGLRSFGVLPNNILTVNALQFGSALEMILLAFALADRFNVIRREKAKSQRELLQAQANTLEAQKLLVENLKSSERVLEERVQQRTAALSESNVALVASNKATEASRQLATQALESLRSTQTQLERANGDFRRLLDNSGEGFLTFGANRVIDGQYSLACESMLGGSPAGRNAAEVFFQDDADKVDLFCTIIDSVLGEADADTRNVMLTLLPTEIERGEVVLKAEYKALEHSKFMVVLTDITAERRMAFMLSRERRRLELIVMAVSDSRNFFETVDAFREFLVAGLPRRLQSEAAVPVLVNELYREIHTYKGLLSQFSFPGTPKVLHDIETRLSAALTLDHSLSRQQLAELVSPQSLLGPFNADLSILSEALGEDFLARGDTIVLTDVQARQLETLAKRLLRGEPVDTSAAELRRLLHEIGTLRKVSLCEVLMGFDGLVRQAANRLEKEVMPLAVQGGADIWVDPNVYRQFFHALVHVFRNAVAHGLETPEVREKSAKNEAGQITCQVALEAQNIELRIADDGRGIDLAALRRRAVAAGLYDAETVKNVADHDIVQLIFMDHISTQQELSDLAGRGVGLAAVLSETRNLGGSVRVTTQPGQGTEFLFVMPFVQNITSEEA